MNAPPPFRPDGVSEQSELNARRWQTLKVRPWSLMKLKEKINPLFPAGAIVSLSNELRVEYSTPTKYQGQGSTNDNANTRVRVYRWYNETTINSVRSRDGGKPLSIQHKHLVNPADNQLANRGWELGQLAKVVVPSADRNVHYKTKRYQPKPEDQPGDALDIPNGTVGKVVKCMTATNRPRTAEQAASSTRVDWWYVIDVDVRQTKWCWVPCQDWLPISFLLPVSAEEVQQTEDLIRRMTGKETGPEVVSKLV